MKRRILAAQHISRMCMVCGKENPSGLHAKFYELEDGELLGVFAPEVVHQGYPGRLHGGVASTMLDETIGRAINIIDPDVWGVTVELTVRFRKPVPLDGDVRAIGRITRDTSRLFEGIGEIVLPDGVVAVEAKGKYMKLPIGEIVAGDFEADWFADERERPESVDV
jgi:acyl-coenzyme A thioesterase PaaI-like protein